MGMMHMQPSGLSGEYIRLEPLSETHVPGLAIVGQDREIWRYLPYGELTDEKKMLAHVRLILARAEQGTDLPFAVILQETGQPVGCTRYLEISHEHHKLEIGGTWYGIAYQRTRVNTECKYLLLKRAFEELGCIRVQFKTNAKNERSKRSLERIGAKWEGVLRNHMIMPDGEIRDSVFFSILSREWPSVKQILLDKLAKTYS